MDRRTFFRKGVIAAGTLMTMEKALGLAFYPNPSGKRWAVLYGTWCGTARDAGVWISEGMGGIADVFDIREGADLTGYDHLVIGGAIRGGKVSPLLEAFLEKNRMWIPGKVRGLYAVCGNLQRPITPEVVRRHIDDYLAPLCGVREVPSAVFLGRMTRALLEPELRERMKGFGEYDHLKRADCMAFGREILHRTDPQTEVAIFGE